jgi:hypothetical protein
MDNALAATFKIVFMMPVRGWGTRHGFFHAWLARSNWSLQE